MRGGTFDHLYLGTNGALCKIGISRNPVRRAETLKIRLVRTWKRPWARVIETGVKGILAYAAAEGTEWFRIDLGEMLFLVTRAVRIEDDDQAMKLGLEPSPRPGPDDPPFEPPFELEWLSRPTIAKHWRRNETGESPRFVRVTKPEA